MHTTTVFAEKEKAGDAEIYEMVKSFAKCAAFFDAFSDVSKAGGDKDTAQVLSDISNGAELVAEALARYGEIKDEKNFIAGIYGTELPFFKSIINNSGANDPAIVAETAICKELSPLQGQLVEEIRKKAYGVDTSNNKIFK